MPPKYHKCNLLQIWCNYWHTGGSGWWKWWSQSSWSKWYFASSQVLQFYSVIFDRVLSCSKGLSDALKSTHLDLGKAADLVTSTIQTLEQFRTNDEWEKVLTYSHTVADVHGVSPCESSTRPSRNPRPLRRFESDIITGTTGGRVESTWLQSWFVLFCSWCFFIGTKTTF